MYSNIKDEILLEIFKTGLTELRFDLNNDFAIKHGVSPEIIEGFFKEFESRGFISYSGLSKFNALVSLESPFFTFLEQGAYESENRISSLQKQQLTLNVETLELQLEKLKAELESVKKVDPKLFERICAICSQIATTTGVAIKFTS
ncbi:hypothetical protein MY04_4785 [Flammeovirga sp. MY04]|uniref:hypothetical protein n=1 Tax=Flammeovirga sp. MY04 TaxID=1191459 RepID=UPI00080631A9|nr:hypothetical protein [Flammeovirga sp. MY04]ANQ49602.1 hypothetical protein MY04_2228 [Flammeovirga sp. MY04]ANQ52120.1 hypothetical protein MY04_4785 [Flammeovirga sp. MY04]